jgi:hypothetical protein
MELQGLRNTCAVSQSLLTICKAFPASGAFTSMGFDNGTVILVDGVEQGTANDSGGPTTMLISKKGGKKIKPGRTALIQVKTSTGIFSEGLVFTRPSQ